MTKKTKKFMKTVADVFGKKNCSVSLTCVACGISRQTFNVWLKEDPYFAELIDDSKEAQIDWWEQQAIKKGLDGDSSMIQFMLRTKAGSRGYDPAQVVKVSGSINAEITNTDVKKAITEVANMLKLSGIEPTEENISKALEQTKEKTP